MTTTWDDDGPASQGKIITAILRGDQETADRLLAGWSTWDLVLLSRAARTLDIMCARAQLRRRDTREG